MLVFEQFDQEMPTDNVPPEEQEQQEEQDPLDEIEPLKKYYLSKKLIGLQSKLFRHGIQRDDLDLILKFQNELSYRVLMILCNGILKQIEIEFGDLTKEKKSSEK